MTQKLRCSSCGDASPREVEHVCWVIEKMKTQETKPSICGVCGHEEPNGLRHWRCHHEERETLDGT